MYHIFQTSLGQPIILWQESSTICLYSIKGGRIISHNTICTNSRSTLIPLYCTVNNLQMPSFLYVDSENKIILSYIHNFKTISRTIGTKNTPDGFHKAIVAGDTYLIFFSCIKKNKICINGINCLNPDIVVELLNFNLDEYKFCNCSFFAIGSFIKFYSETNKGNIIYTLDLNLKIISKDDMSVKYNELLNYAGKLQDKLRHYKYNCP